MCKRSESEIRGNKCDMGKQNPALRNVQIFRRIRCRSTGGAKLKLNSILIVLSRVGCESETEVG